NRSTGSEAVPGSSLTRVATLGALKGHEIEVTATGNQAKEAVEHIVAMAARRFDAADATTAAQETAPRQVDEPPVTSDGPLPASPGIAIGPARLLAAPAVDLSGVDQSASDPDEEWRRVRTAVASASREIAETRDRTAREAGEPEAAIFDAHLMLLGDPQLLGDVRQRIEAGRSAPHAWSEAMVGAANDLEALPDEYQRARAADVRGLREQVLLAMLGRPAATDVRPGVLIAADLTP